MNGFNMNLINLFSALPHSLSVIILSMVPVMELRGSIPLAVGLYQMPLWQAFIFSIIGSVVIALVILYFLDGITKILMDKTKIGHRFFTWLFDRTRRKFSGKYLKYGEIALIIFVAIPLPVTGVWTGSLAAYLFGIDKKRALVYITIGAMIAGLIVSILTFSGFFIFSAR